MFSGGARPGKGRARLGPTLRIRKHGQRAHSCGEPCALHSSMSARVCGSHSRQAHRSDQRHLHPRCRRNLGIGSTASGTSLRRLFAAHNCIAKPLERPAERVGTEQHEIRRVVDGAAACQMRLASPGAVKRMKTPRYSSSRRRILCWSGDMSRCTRRHSHRYMLRLNMNTIMSGP